MNTYVNNMNNYVYTVFKINAYVHYENIGYVKQKNSALQKYTFKNKWIDVYNIFGFRLKTYLCVVCVFVSKAFHTCET